MANDDERNKVIVLLSGGLDSSTLLYWAKAQGYAVSGLGFDYGQRHIRELRAARDIAEVANVPFNIIRLGYMEGGRPELMTRPLGDLLSGSALTDSSVEVPQGHYEAETMKQTIVPNRNMIMISIASGIALAQGAVAVATAVHSGDHAIYPKAA